LDRTYLGDGVYVAFDGARDHIVLTTENGVCVNTIYLDGEVLAALELYVARLRERIKAISEKAVK
jgi:hypothetical protein